MKMNSILIALLTPFIAAYIILFKSMMKDSSSNLLIINLSKTTNWRKWIRFIIYISFVALFAIVTKCKIIYILILSILLFVSIIILCYKMEIEYSFNKIVAIRNAQDHLNAKLYIEYNDNKLNITQDDQLHNMNIKYSFQRLFDQWDMSEYELDTFEIIIYKNNQIIYKKDTNYFYEIYDKQQSWYNFNKSIHKSKFIKIALNDAIFAIIECKFIKTII